MNLKDAIGTISKFTNTAIISPEDTYFGGMGQSFFGLVKVHDPKLTKEIGLYDEINNLGRMLVLFEDPEIEIEGNNLKIFEKDTEAYFITSDISLIRKDEFDNAEQLERTLSVPKCFHAPVSDELIQRLSKAAGSIDNASLIITANDGAVHLTLKDIDILSSNSNSLKIDITEISTVQKDFNVELDAGIANRLPKGGFELELVYSERVGTYRAIFKQEEVTVVVSCTAIEE